MSFIKLPFYKQTCYCQQFNFLFFGDIFLGAHTSQPVWNLLWIQHWFFLKDWWYTSFHVRCLELLVFRSSFNGTYNIRMVILCRRQDFNSFIFPPVLLWKHNVSVQNFANSLHCFIWVVHRYSRNQWNMCTSRFDQWHIFYLYAFPQKSSSKYWSGLCCRYKGHHSYEKEDSFW